MVVSQYLPGGSVCRKLEVKIEVLRRVSGKALIETRPAGLEPATYGFEGRRSIQLSYGRISLDHLLSWILSVRQALGPQRVIHLTSSRAFYRIPPSQRFFSGALVWAVLAFA